MKLCAISFKPCWQDENGRWVSNGGFPLQMTWIGSLFDTMTLVITDGKPEGGGLPLPAHATVIPIRLPDGSNLRRKISFATNLLYYLRVVAPHVRDADVVHVPLPGDIPFLAMLLAFCFRKRLIVRYGSSWARTAQSTLMTSTTKNLMRWMAGGRNVMLATGEGPVPPAPGVSWIFSTAITRAELSHTPCVTNGALHTPPRIAYIGRLADEKGLPNLIEAFGVLDREGIRPLPVVTLIGDGPDKEKLMKLIANRGYQEFFRFAGQVDRVTLSNLLQEQDFCVQPSLTEGFSKAWLDAFAHGLPVLASDVGAAAPVIGVNHERGWLVPPGDVARLADRLRDVLTQTNDWTALRKRCREYTEKRTLEEWAQSIGRTCASQWNITLVDGRLRA